MFMRPWRIVEALFVQKHHGNELVFYPKPPLLLKIHVPLSECPTHTRHCTALKSFYGRDLKPPETVSYSQK